MTQPAIVVSTTTLTKPHGAGSDYALYSLDLFGGTLYAGGWLNGTVSSPSNPDGVGLDRIYVSSGPTLDDFSRVQWTSGQSPGTWNQTSTTPVQRGGQSRDRYIYPGDVLRPRQDG